MDDVDQAEAEAWADAHAVDLVADVARHGVPITWGEARWRLLGAAAVMRATECAPDDDGQWTPIVRKSEPWSDRLWLRPEFVGEVAAGAVHYAGRVYFPADPGTSTIGIALPLDVASELVTHLSTLLHETWHLKPRNVLARPHRQSCRLLEQPAEVPNAAQSDSCHAAGVVRTLRSLRRSD